jgi:hypothetical protein
MMPLPPHQLDRLVAESQASLRRSAAPLRGLDVRLRLGRLLVAAGTALAGEPVERAERARGAARASRRAACTPELP